jgi:two-component system cell cycle response regulator DivK
MKGDEDKIRQCGCNGYISKPISIATFIETISNSLNAEEMPVAQAE